MANFNYAYFFQILILKVWMVVLSIYLHSNNRCSKYTKSIVILKYYKLVIKFHILAGKWIKWGWDKSFLPLQYPWCAMSGALISLLRILVEWPTVWGIWSKRITQTHKIKPTWHFYDLRVKQRIQLWSKYAFIQKPLTHISPHLYLSSWWQKYCK